MIRSEVHNIDCMEFMASLPDKSFELAVVDPPYGNAGFGPGGDNGTRFGGKFRKYMISRQGPRKRQKIIEWDIAPDKMYFTELFRVAKNVIIWGGNHFDLPPCRCYLVWVKTDVQDGMSFGMCEYAWTNFNAPPKVFHHQAGGQKHRFHPTQKPIALYSWIFHHFAKPGMTILDTRLGSGSSRIAAHKAGFDFVGMEIENEYFEKQEKRFDDYLRQGVFNFKQEKAL